MFGLERLPSSTRAWALQEPLISPRVVHFTDGILYWECLDTRSCESGETLASQDEGPTNSMLMNVSGSRQTAEQSKDLHLTVKVYISQQLTASKDMLPALQGVARNMQNK
jgi:hypothetical protein